MTIKHVAWARRQAFEAANPDAADRRVSNGVAKAVLIVLASHADEAGKAWPSVETISEEVLKSATTVERATRHLERLGLIERCGRYKRGRCYTTNVWKLVMNRASDGEERRPIETTPRRNDAPSKRRPVDQIGDAPSIEHIDAPSLSTGPYKEERLSGESTEEKECAREARWFVFQTEKLREVYPADRFGDPKGVEKALEKAQLSADEFEKLLAWVRRRAACVDAAQREGRFFRGFPDLRRCLGRKQWQWEALPETAEAGEKAETPKGQESAEAEELHEFTPRQAAEASDLWAKAKARLAEAVDGETFAAWIEPTEPVGMNGAGLYLAVDSGFFRSWLESSLREEIEGAIAEVNAGDGRFRVVVHAPP